jgi:DNA repair exonuclease SbcCD nuclease subunit
VIDIVQSSDWHLDHTTRGVARFDDISTVVDETVKYAVDLAVQEGFPREVHYCFTGDLCDPDKNLSVVRAQRKAISVAIYLAKYKIKSHWIPGNHCVIEDGSGSSVLTPMLALAQDEHLGRWVHVYDSPSIEDFGTGWKLLALPFTPLSHAYDPTEWCAKVINDPSPLVVMSHLSVDGIVAGEETKEMPRGRSILLPLGMLKARSAPTVILQGHYHDRHVTPEGLAGKDVIIPGSLARLTFGEEDNEPGFLHLELR